MSRSKRPEIAPGVRRIAVGDRCSAFLLGETRRKLEILEIDLKSVTVDWQGSRWRVPLKDISHIRRS